MHHSVQKLELQQLQESTFANTAGAYAYSTSTCANARSGPHPAPHPRTAGDVPFGRNAM